MIDRTDSPSPTLRERQSQRVRDDLRDAFIRLTVERGNHGFILHDVAEAAGVSDRTLYRYYASRESLVDDVLAHAAVVVADAQRERGLGTPDGSWLERPDAIADAFDVFEQHSDVVRAAALIREDGTVDRRHAERTSSVRDALASRGVAPEALDAMVALVRVLSGSEGWSRLTAPEFGLESRQAGLAAHWAIQVLVRAATEHDGPLHPTFDQPTSDDGSGRDPDGDERTR